MYDYGIERMNAEHRYQKSRLSEVAEKRRLLAANRVYQPRIYHHMLAKAADWMIETGTSLKKRYAAAQIMPKQQQTI